MQPPLGNLKVWPYKRDGYWWGGKQHTDNEFVFQKSCGCNERGVCLWALSCIGGLLYYLGICPLPPLVTTIPIATIKQIPWKCFSDFVVQSEGCQKNSINLIIPFTQSSDMMNWNRIQGVGWPNIFYNPDSPCHKCGWLVTKPGFPMSLCKK